MTKKLRYKLLRLNKKQFSSFWKGFQWRKQLKFFGRWKPDFKVYHLWGLWPYFDLKLSTIIRILPSWVCDMFFCFLNQCCMMEKTFAIKKSKYRGKRHQNYWQYFLGVPNRGVISFSIIFVALSLQKLFGLLHNDMYWGSIWNQFSVECFSSDNQCG